MSTDYAAGLSAGLTEAARKARRIENRDAVLAEWLVEKTRILADLGRPLLIVVVPNAVGEAFDVRFLDPVDCSEVQRGTADTPTLAFESALSEYLYDLGEAEAVEETMDAMRGHRE